jgi:hypothetical protein
MRLEPETRAERIEAWRIARQSETFPALGRRLQAARARRRFVIAVPDPDKAHLSHTVRLWRVKGAGWSRNPGDADRLPGTVARRIVRLMQREGLPAEVIRIPDYSSERR